MKGKGNWGEGAVSPKFWGLPKKIKNVFNIIVLTAYYILFRY